MSTCSRYLLSVKVADPGVKNDNNESTIGPKKQGLTEFNKDPQVKAIIIPDKHTDIPGTL